jgi:UDP-glucose 4-epimerase
LVGIGARVTVLDNFSTGNINNLKNAFPFITIHCASITSEYAAFKATENKDLVFHLAANASVPFSINNPDICFEVNVKGTHNMLNGCIQGGVQHFIFSSSSAVYGNTDTVCTEETPLNPVSPYAESKILGEQLCKQYSTEHSLATTALRYFNVYGERQSTANDYSSVVTRFRHALLNQLPVTIFGDGSQTRDFIPVAEVVRANLLLGSNSTHKGDIYNIASGKSITLLDLLLKLEEELRVQRVVTRFMPAREGDIKHSIAHCAKYQQALNAML